MGGAAADHVAGRHGHAGLVSDGPRLEPQVLQQRVGRAQAQTGQTRDRNGLRPAGKADGDGAALFELAAGGRLLTDDGAGLGVGVVGPSGRPPGEGAEAAVVARPRTPGNRRDAGTGWDGVSTRVAATTIAAAPPSRITTAAARATHRQRPGDGGGPLGAPCRSASGLRPVDRTGPGRSSRSWRSSAGSRPSAGATCRRAPHSRSTPGISPGRRLVGTSLAGRRAGAGPDDRSGCVSRSASPAATGPASGSGVGRRELGGHRVEGRARPAASRRSAGSTVPAASSTGRQGPGRAGTGAGCSTRAIRVAEGGVGGERHGPGRRLDEHQGQGVHVGPAVERLALGPARGRRSGRCRPRRRPARSRWPRPGPGPARSRRR